MKIQVSGLMEQSIVMAFVLQMIGSGMDIAMMVCMVHILTVIILIMMVVIVMAAVQTVQVVNMNLVNMGANVVIQPGKNLVLPVAN